MNKIAADLSEFIMKRAVNVPADEEFLRELYFSTRDDLNILPLGEAQKNALLQMQFDAQRRQYAAQTPFAAHEIILLNKQQIGQILIVRENDFICLADISLLPTYRNLGIGTFLINDILTEAEQGKKNFILHVLKTNPAIKLYKRLGLVVAEDSGFHFKMERRL
jgi:ribosomal protein S18 acetylase RimI-like enzyme